MEIIFEILYEFIVEGSLEAVTDKKAPLIVRIIAGILVFVIYGGIVGLCFFFGIKNRSIVLIVLGVFVSLLIFLGLFMKFRRKYGGTAPGFTVKNEKKFKT